MTPRRTDGAAPRPDRATRGSIPLRVTIVTALGLALVGGLGYFVWDEVQELEQQVVRLEDGLEEAEEKAGRAVERAEEAEDRADAAARRAEEADQRADAALMRARESDEAKAAAEAERTEALARADEARERAAAAEEEAERIRAQRRAELDRLQEALARIVETRRTALGLIMNLGEDRIQFDFDRAELRPEARELLSRIVGVLLTSPDGYMVQVYGHTDDVGSAEYNQNLSERRARAVRDYLVEAGIPEEIIITRGFGKSSPLVSGIDPESRQQNRRVEIGIVDTVVEYKRAADDETDGSAKKKKGGHR